MVAGTTEERGHFNLLVFLHWQDVKPGATNISLSIFREDQAKAETSSQEKR